jgi:hypothetical protein
MKLNEFLLGVVTPLFEKKDDAELFVSASALKDIEVPDDVAAKFNTKFLTRERALSDEQILAKVNKDSRGRVFDSVDLKLKKFISKLSQEDQDAINNEPNTLLKLELLDKAIDNVAKTQDTAKISEAARKREEELHKQIEGLTKTISEKDVNLQRQVKEVKLDYALRNKAFGIELAPEFATDKHKNFLADSTIADLKKKYLLEFDESDQSIIHLRKNVDGVIADVFEGNTKVTLDDVLKKEYEPYTKKSTAGDTNKTQQQQQKAQPQLPSDGPKDLYTRMREAATA